MILIIYLKNVGFQVILGVSGLTPHFVRSSKCLELGLGSLLSFLSQRVDPHVLPTSRVSDKGGRNIKGSTKAHKTSDKYDQINPFSNWI